MIDEDEIERHLRISKDMWSDLVMLQSWPQQRYFNPRGWVQNFRKSEIPYALRLIDNMTYYSDEMSKALLRVLFTDYVKSFYKMKHVYITIKLL